MRGAVESRGRHVDGNTAPEAELRRESLAVRTIAVTLRAAVAKTEGNPRLAPSDRDELVAEMAAWAERALRGHASSVRGLRAKWGSDERLASLFEEVAGQLAAADREVAALRGEVPALTDEARPLAAERRLSEA